MSRGITHAIEIPGRGKVYSRDWIRNNPEIWQRLIREMRDSGGTAICRCSGNGAKDLIPCLVQKTYFLKKTPHSGPNHHSDCAFYQMQTNACGLKAYTEDVVTMLDDGDISIRLEVGLLPINAEGPKKDDTHARRHGRAKTAMTLIGLLNLLWQQAKFNIMRPGMRGKRSGTVFAAKMRDAASDILTSRQRISNFLVVLAPNDSSASLYPALLQNQAVIKRTLAKGRRALLLGEIHPASLFGDEAPGFLDQRFHKIRTQFSMDAMETLRRQLAGHVRAIDDPSIRVLVLAAATIYPGQPGNPQPLAEIQACGGMIATKDYVPVASSHEWRLAAHLVDQGRSFTKPLRFDADADEVLPDFILLDSEKPYFPMEVYGMATPEYAERQREKDAYYSTTFGLDGHWSWEPLLSRDIPALPPIARERA